MPSRNAPQIAQAIGRAAGSIYEIQLNQLQQTQRAQSTLAMQRHLREMDQVFMQKIQNQLSNADPQQQVTEDWMNEDFRQQRLREMFDERMQEVRGMVSTPEGQMELETRSEAMWQQYEFGWRDKSIEAMKAWNLQAGQTILDGYAANATREDADEWWAIGDEHIRSMVASGTLRPEMMGRFQEQYQRMIFDRVAREEIVDPRRRDSEGNTVPFGDYDIDDMYDHSDSYIGDLVSSGKVSNAHAQELRQFNDSVREQRRQQIADGYTVDSMSMLSQLADIQLAAKIAVELDYAELIPQFRDDDAYNIMDADMKKAYDGRVYTEINRLNQRIRERTGNFARDAAHGFEADVRYLANTHLPTAVRMVTAGSPEYNKIMNTLADSPVERNQVLKFIESIRPVLTRQADARLDLNIPAHRRIEHGLRELNIDPASEGGRIAISLIHELAGGDGRHDDISPDVVNEVLRIVANEQITELFHDGGVFRTPDVEKMGRAGFEFDLLADTLSALGREEVSTTLTGRLIEEVARRYPQVVTREGTGHFRVEDLLHAATEIVAPGRKLEDLSPAEQNLIRTLQYSSAALIEALDLGGLALMDKFGFDNYDLIDLSFDRNTQMPYFRISAPDNEGRLMEHQFYVNAINPNEMMIYHLLPDPRTGDLAVNFEWSVNDMRRIIRGTERTTAEQLLDDVLGAFLGTGGKDPEDMTPEERERHEGAQAEGAVRTNPLGDTTGMPRYNLFGGGRQ